MRAPVSELGTSRPVITTMMLSIEEVESGVRTFMHYALALVYLEADFANRNNNNVNEIGYR